MMNTRVERVFNFAIYTALVISGLQLLTTVTAKPLPAEGATDTNYNATTWKNQTILKNSSKCNSTNLAMIVDGNFLYKWCASFDSDHLPNAETCNTHEPSHHHHSISHLSEAAKCLEDDTKYLEVSIDASHVCSLRIIWATFMLTPHVLSAI